MKTLCSTRLRRAGRGSVLVTCLLLSAIIGISLATYIRLGHTALKISNRALYANAAMNLAENGLEEAMGSVNLQLVDASYSWPGWTKNSFTRRAKRQFPTPPNYTRFDQNAFGYVRVFVYEYTGVSAPLAVARARVQLGGGLLVAGAPVEKWVAVQLRRTSRFANGLVAKEKISFSGNGAGVDSWNSDPDNNPATAALPYDATTKRDNGSVGSISVSVDSVAVQNANIWGFAATGGALPSVGANGSIGPYGTPNGSMDMGRVSTDFAANFDPVAQPSGGASVGLIKTATTLGAAGSTTVYQATAIDLKSSNALTINGNVTLYITAAAGADAITLAGNAGIIITPGSKFTIYTAGNVKIAGNGVLNGSTTVPNQPINFQLWGTSAPPSSKQTMDIVGNGYFSGIVYAPNATVAMRGSGSAGDVMGSIVANDITVVGAAQFHYDESLANFGGNNPFRVTKWDELNTPTQRAPYYNDLVTNWWGSL